jgi:hypothetical protein
VDAVRLSEVIARVGSMPPGLVAYMLTTYSIKHSEEFEQTYLNGMLHNIEEPDSEQ